MSVAAVMLVKDEADVIAATIEHLLDQVDAILVADNLSTDGTREILEGYGEPVKLFNDPEVGYWQARKTTALAALAAGAGYDWVLPVDADEMWIATDGRRIRDFLRSVAPDVGVIRATLYNYLATAEDESGMTNPFRRIRWRLAEPSSLGKVAARTWDGLAIEAGNHGASFDGEAPRLVGGGLRVNHYSWRSPEQYARKIVNGARAYAETDLPESTGAHWRMWGDPYSPALAARAAAHFGRYFFATDPPRAPGSTDPATLVYDPPFVVDGAEEDTP